MTLRNAIGISKGKATPPEKRPRRRRDVKIESAGRRGKIQEEKNEGDREPNQNKLPTTHLSFRSSIFQEALFEA